MTTSSLLFEKLCIDRIYSNLYLQVNILSLTVGWNYIVHLLSNRGSANFTSSRAIAKIHFFLNHFRGECCN
ncbi:hypothetical protein ALT717_730001 [Alteromonas macleodii]